MQITISYLSTPHIWLHGCLIVGNWVTLYLLIDLFTFVSSKTKQDPGKQEFSGLLATIRIQVLQISCRTSQHTYGFIFVWPQMQKLQTYLTPELGW